MNDDLLKNNADNFLQPLVAQMNSMVGGFSKLFLLEWKHQKVI